IQVYQIPEVCERIVDTPVIVLENKKFEAEITGTTAASCFGAADGTITLEVSNFNAAGYQYSIDGGAHWSADITDPETTISGLGAGDYTIMVRKADEHDCGFDLAPRTVTEPDEVKVSANITSVYNCTNGGAT